MGVRVRMGCRPAVSMPPPGRTLPAGPSAAPRPAETVRDGASRPTADPAGAGSRPRTLPPRHAHPKPESRRRHRSGWRRWGGRCSSWRCSGWCRRSPNGPVGRSRRTPGPTSRPHPLAARPAARPAWRRPPCRRRPPHRSSGSRLPWRDRPLRRGRLLCCGSRPCRTRPRCRTRLPCRGRQLPGHGHHARVDHCDRHDRHDHLHRCDRHERLRRCRPLDRCDRRDHRAARSSRAHDVRLGRRGTGTPPRQSRAAAPSWRIQGRSTPRRRRRTHPGGRRGRPPGRWWDGTGRGPVRVAGRGRVRRPGSASARAAPRDAAAPPQAHLWSLRGRRGAAPRRPPSGADRPATYAGVGAAAPPVSNSRPS